MCSNTMLIEYTMVDKVTSEEGERPESSSNPIGAIRRKVSDRILIMHKGSIVEEGSSSKIFEHPENDYTRALIDAIPGRKLQVG